MNAMRCLLVLSMVSATTVVGCQDDPAPTPASPEASATTAPKEADAKPKKPVSKLDPLAVKTYRAESCYFGTISLRQARAAYQASLGGAEPAEGKIPNFGTASLAEPAPILKDFRKDAKPGASGSAAAAAAPAPAASGSAASPKARALANRMRPVPYERHARSCTVAAGIKTPPAEGLDEALAEYAPYAVQLAKDIALAAAYYNKEEYKQDKFAKGKELHTKLTEGFAKLDEMHKKLGDALTTFQGKNKPDTSKDTEGQKLSAAAVDSAREAMVLFSGDALDAAKAKEKLAELDKNVEALKKFGGEHKEDAWARIVAPSLETFSKEGTRVAGVPDAKATSPDDLLQLVTFFTRVLEAQNRGLTRQVSGGPAEFMRKRPKLQAPTH